VLEANPDYRAIRFPASGDPARAALERTMAGKALPQVGLVDIAVIEEDATRILEFERGNLDAIIVRSSVVNRLLANGQLKPEFAARGIVRQVAAEPYTFSFNFNMKDPALGGYAREGIALRRAIALGTDIGALIDVVYAGQALPANQMLPPNVRGHDPSLPGKSRYDPGAAKALLDRAGYDLRDAAGYRLAPGGKPLTLTFSLRAAGISREVQTLVHRNMEALGLRMEFRVSPFQDLIKELEAGKYQLYFGGYGGQPVGNGILLQLYSRAPAAQNSTRFALPEYDAQMKRFLRAATASEQIAAARSMSEIAENYVPLLPIVFRLENNFTQPWVQGYLPPLFDTYWKYLDIDLAQRKQALGK
jgi:ABC-type transport system substrate-binding protein